MLDNVTFKYSDPTYNARRFIIFYMNWKDIKEYKGYSKKYFLTTDMPLYKFNIDIITELNNTNTIADFKKYYVIQEKLDLL